MVVVRFIIIRVFSLLAVPCGVTIAQRCDAASCLPSALVAVLLLAVACALYVPWTDASHDAACILDVAL